VLRVCRATLDSEYQQLREDLDVMRMEVLTHGNGGINIPVNLRRLIWNAQVSVCLCACLCVVIVLGCLCPFGS
jgi:hypothetical protein